MRIYPAIDLKGGCVVRAPDGSRIYDLDPLGRAERFLAAGAEWLHVVDLDRAFGTGGDNSRTIRALASLAGARLQMGGLIRTASEVAEAFELGASRVVLSTEMVSHLDRLAAIVEEFGPDRLAGNIDVRGGQVVIRGSDVAGRLSPLELCDRILEFGIRTVVYRDLGREGALSGPDIEGAAQLAARGVQVLLSGGFASIGDLKAAHHCGVAGAILGRALYEGTIELGEAIACCS